MSLHIGDVSKLLDLPVETIRYYESQKIISPSRKNDSKYRIYEPWDVFYLIECLKYRSYDISVKDISKLINSEPLDFYIKKIRDKHKNVREELNYHKLLDSKLEQYIEVLETLEMNQGNYWFKKLPEELYYTYVSSYGDKYGELQGHNHLFSKWSRYLPLVDFGIAISGNDILSNNENLKINWTYVIEKQLAEALNLPVDDSVQTIPEGICLCTVVDIGGRDELTYDSFRAVEKYLKDTDYKIRGDIFGKLHARIHKDNNFCRYIELQIPVKPK